MKGLVFCDRRLASLFAVAIFIAYVVCALAPFRWEPPRQVNNGAVTSQGNAIRFPKAGMTLTRKHADWLDHAMQLNEFTVRLRVRPWSTKQSGPARILTVSEDAWLRNVTIAQRASDLVLRLRTPETSLNGQPDYVVPDVFIVRQWREIELIVRPGRLRLKVNDQIVLEDNLPAEPLRNWHPRYRVVFGNELTSDRPWIGEIATALVIVDGRAIDYMKSDQMEIPATFWVGLDLK